MTSPMPTQTLPPTRTWSAVLFDLDGTIIDSASDITTSLAHTFSTLGLPVPSEDDLLAFVGPPLLDSFRMIPEFSEADAWRCSQELIPACRDQPAVTGHTKGVRPAVHTRLKAHLFGLAGHHGSHGSHGSRRAPSVAAGKLPCGGRT